MNPQQRHSPSNLYVKPYQKKYIQGVPGSSPVTRPSDELNYHQIQGKGPLIERAERIRQMNEMGRNQSAMVREESQDQLVRMVVDDRYRGSNEDEQQENQNPMYRGSPSQHDLPNI